MSTPIYENIIKEPSSILGKRTRNISHYPMQVMKGLVSNNPNQVKSKSAKGIKTRIVRRTRRTRRSARRRRTRRQLRTRKP